MARTQKAQTQFRQGDVLIERVASIPTNATARAREQGHVVLAHGEVTGHAHAIREGGAALLDTPDGLTYLRLDEVSQLMHEEHATIELPAGGYRVTRQREYSPEEIRNVAD